MLIGGILLIFFFASSSLTRHLHKLSKRASCERIVQKGIVVVARLEEGYSRKILRWLTTSSLNFPDNAEIKAVYSVSR